MRAIVQRQRALTRSILSASTNLAYTIHPGTGPHLLLVHGFLSSSRQWLHNLPALAEVCIPVTVDLYGHGRSPAPETPEYYQPQVYIDALEQIRAEIGAQQWFAAGYSLGAGITVRYTHQHPDKVLGHIFTNSSSAFADAAQVEKWQKDAAATSERLIQGGLHAVRRIAVHPRFAKRLPAELYAVLNEDAERLSPTAVAHTMAITTPQVNVRDIIASNPRPALMCYGKLEKRFTPYKVWVEEHMADLQIADLQAGHAVNMEDSAGFNAAVTQFITQHMP